VATGILFALSDTIVKILASWILISCNILAINLWDDLVLAMYMLRGVSLAVITLRFPIILIIYIHYV
jgi:hypothetical protein